MTQEDKIWMEKIMNEITDYFKNKGVKFFIQFGIKDNKSLFNGIWQTCNLNKQEIIEIQKATYQNIINTFGNQ